MYMWIGRILRKNRIKYQIKINNEYVPYTKYKIDYQPSNENDTWCKDIIRVKDAWLKDAWLKDLKDRK